jgi:hypothetical protein
MCSGGKMSNHTAFPPIESHLPALMRLVSQLARAVEHGEIDSWQGMTQRVEAFFRPDIMEQVDAVAPGWREMSSYANGVTLVHVMCVFTSLLLCPEYQQATAEQQALLKWIVLFHDIAKKVQEGRRDYIHGFRSAAIAGEMLPKFGFVVTNEYAALISAWAALTNGAVTKGDTIADYIQDNHKVPEIFAGIEKLLGRNTPAALIVKTVLLHMSITVIHEWPQAAPLTAAEVKQCIDAELFPLLKIMMLVDNDGWSRFDPPTKERYRLETLVVFDEIKRQIGL